MKLLVPTLMAVGVLLLVQEPVSADTNSYLMKNPWNVKGYASLAIAQTWSALWSRLDTKDLQLVCGCQAKITKYVAGQKTLRLQEYIEGMVECGLLAGAGAALLSTRSMQRLRGMINNKEGG